MQHPEQIIAEAIQTGFVKYPLEDDETVWNDEWIQPTESKRPRCTHLVIVTVQNNRRHPKVSLKSVHAWC